MNTLINQFNQFLTKNFFIPEALIKPWKHIRSDLGLNSIEFLEMIVYVENTFGIQIPDENLSQIHTIQDLTDYLEANLVPLPA